MSGYAGFAEFAEVILRGAAARSILLRRAGQFLLASQLDRLAAEVANDLAHIGGSKNVMDFMARCQSLGGARPAPLSASYSPAELREFRTVGAQAGLTRQETDQSLRESINKNAAPALAKTVLPANARRPPGSKGDKP